MRKDQDISGVYIDAVGGLSCGREVKSLEIEGNTVKINASSVNVQSPTTIRGERQKFVEPNILLTASSGPLIFSNFLNVTAAKVLISALNNNITL